MSIIESRQHPVAGQSTPSPPCWLEVMSSTCCGVMQPSSPKRSCPWSRKLEVTLLSTLCCVSQITESTFGLLYVCALTGWLLRTVPLLRDVPQQQPNLLKPRQGLQRTLAGHSLHLDIINLSKKWHACTSYLPLVWLLVTLEGIVLHTSYLLAVLSSGERRQSLAQ